MVIRCRSGWRRQHLVGLMGQEFRITLVCFGYCLICKKSRHVSENCSDKLLSKIFKSNRTTDSGKKRRNQASLRSNLQHLWINFQLLRKLSNWIDFQLLRKLSNYNQREKTSIQFILYFIDLQNNLFIYQIIL